MTADARQMSCTATENADLFWAARGAGPGFPAIVTRFYLRTRPLPSGMHVSLYFYPLSEFATVLQWVIDVRLALVLHPRSMWPGRTTALGRPFP